MDYRQLFIDVSDSITRNIHLIVLKNDIGEPVPSDDLSYELALRRFNIVLFQKLLDLYYSVGYYHIEWECNLKDHVEIAKFHPDDTVVSGQIVIRTLDEMLEFDKKMEADWWVKNLDSEEKISLYDFRYFDFNDDDTRVGYILQQNAIIEKEFYFITQGAQGFYPANLNFEAYLKTMTMYKGYQGWQKNHFFQNTTNYKRMIHYLSQLFNDKIA